MKVLVTRTDRIGDLVLSLPALDLLRTARPDWEIHLMTAPATAPLVAGRPGIARVWTWSDDLDAAANDDLTAALAAEGFAAAVMLQYRRELALLLLRAGIAERYGPRSRLSSWFLLNRGRWQSRSRRDEHEADYNCELAADLAGTGVAPCPGPRLVPDAEALALGRAFRAEHAPGAKVLAFVHPGSGGSALDWNPSRFAAVANGLARRDRWRVFVTGAGADAGVLAAVAPGLDPAVTVLRDAFDLGAFAGVLAAGDVFVGPSTGPLHMAAALDLATVGLYPPVRTMRPRRWGPRGRWVRALEPAVACPENRYCVRESCPHFNCLDGIGVDVVLAAVTALSEERAQGAATAPSAPKESS